MASLRTQIVDAIDARLALVPDFKYRSTDEVRLLASDFQDWELPAVQLIDFGETSRHEMKRAIKTWNLSLEIVMGPTAAAGVSQRLLWDLMETTENTVFADVNLLAAAIPGMIHMKLLGSNTDLHMMKPFYTGRLDIVAEYYQPLVGTC